MQVSALKRDLIYLFAGNAARMLGYGILDVMFALYLVEIGFDPLEIGLFVSATLLGSAGLNLLVTRFSSQVGRRQTLILMSLLMSATGILILFTKNLFVLLAVALIGTLNFTGATTTSFAALDQSILAQIIDPSDRNRFFGRYNTIALLARMLGAFASSLPVYIGGKVGFSVLEGYRMLFMIFLLLASGSAIFSHRLSGSVELQTKAEVPSPAWHHLQHSQRFVGRLALLFGVDALATGFIPQSLIVLWFSSRFGVGAEVLGPFYSIVRLLQAAAYPLAMRLADRFGLLNIIVFSHLPSQLILLCLPLAPSLGSAIVLFLIQQSLSHMDIPTRQAYIVAVVDPVERIPAVSLTNMVRNFSQAISPSMSGLALKTIGLGLPFIFAGAIGGIYDLMMYFSFRRIRIDEG